MSGMNGKRLFNTTEYHKLIWWYSLSDLVKSDISLLFIWFLEGNIAFSFENYVQNYSL